MTFWLFVALLVLLLAVGAPRLLFSAVIGLGVAAGYLAAALACFTVAGVCWLALIPVEAWDRRKHERWLKRHRVPR